MREIISLKKVASQAGRSTKKYQTGILLVLVILFVWGVLASVFWISSNNKQVSKSEASKSQLQDIDEAIARLEAKKQAKLKAEQAERQMAEAKKRADEEAAKNSSENQSKASSQISNCNLATTHIDPNLTDVIVNKKHCLSPLDFTPPDLVNTHGATISAKAAGNFNRMFSDAASAGQGFTVSSSYRSYATQVSTYNYWVSLNGKQAADTVSARPGFSEHQTGLAIDVGANGCNLDCFGSTSQYQWFKDNAAKYGFIQRYYQGYENITGYASEEWHYRYVGVPTALDMKAKGIKTLEQYWGLEGGDYR